MSIRLWCYDGQSPVEIAISRQRKAWRLASIEVAGLNQDTLMAARHILLVTRADDVAAAIADALGFEGVEFLRVRSCDEASERFDDSCEMVIIDLAALETEASALPATLRNEGFGAVVPILFLGSGAEAVSDLGSAIEAGGDGFLKRPLKAALLNAKVQVYLGTAPAATPADDQLIPGPPETDEPDSPSEDLKSIQDAIDDALQEELSALPDRQAERDREPTKVAVPEEEPPPTFDEIEPDEDTAELIERLRKLKQVSSLSQEIDRGGDVDAWVDELVAHDQKSEIETREGADDAAAAIDLLVDEPTVPAREAVSEAAMRGESQELKAQAQARVEVESKRLAQESRRRAETEAQRIEEEARRRARDAALKLEETARQQAEERAREAAKVSEKDARIRAQELAASVEKDARERAEKLSERVQAEAIELAKKEAQALEKRASEEAERQALALREQARQEAEARAKTLAEEARKEAEAGAQAEAKKLEAHARQAAQQEAEMARAKSLKQAQERAKKIRRQVLQAAEGEAREIEAQAAKKAEAELRAAEEQTRQEAEARASDLLKQARLEAERRGDQLRLEAHERATAEAEKISQQAQRELEYETRRLRSEALDQARSKAEELARRALEKAQQEAAELEQALTAEAQQRAENMKVEARARAEEKSRQIEQQIRQEAKAEEQRLAAEAQRVAESVEHRVAKTRERERKLREIEAATQQREQVLQDLEEQARLREQELVELEAQAQARAEQAEERRRQGALRLKQGVFGQKTRNDKARKWLAELRDEHTEVETGPLETTDRGEAEDLSHGADTLPPRSPDPSAATLDSLESTPLQTDSATSRMRKPHPVMPPRPTAQVRMQPEDAPVLGMIGDAPCSPLAPQEGQFEEGQLVAVMAEIAYQQVTGRVDFVLEGGSAQRSLFFEQGLPVLALSTLSRDRFESYLHRKGLLTREQHALARSMQIDRSRPLGVALLEEGLLKTRELFDAVRDHLVEVVIALFEWPSGAFRYSAEKAPSAERVAPASSALQILAEGVRRKFDVPRLLRAVGGPSTLLAPSELERLDDLKLHADEQVAADLLDGVRTLEDLILSAGVDEQVSYRVALIGVAIGAFHIAARGIDPVDADREIAGQHELAIDRERLLERLRQARELDYFSFLGLEREATAYEVERAVAQLLDELDQLRLMGEGQAELQEGIAEVWQVAQDALATLASDRSRERYRHHLKS